MWRDYSWWWFYFWKGFAIGGGLTASIENYISEKGIETEFKPVKVSGGSEIKKTMIMAKAGKLNGNFIEGMMCEGGCINGAAKSCFFCKKLKLTVWKIIKKEKSKVSCLIKY